MPRPLAGVFTIVACVLAAASSAAQECAEAVDEVAQSAQEASLDQVTGQKIGRLLETALELCEQGEQEKAATKLVQARDLVESDQPGQR